MVTTDDQQNKDTNVARGIDFQAVDNILNFDFPATPQQYVHRVGRTARAFSSGSSLTFLTPDLTDQFEALRSHLAKSSEQEDDFKPYTFNMKSVEGFRYRCRDASRAVTKFAVQEARRKSQLHRLLYKQSHHHQGSKQTETNRA